MLKKQLQYSLTNNKPVKMIYIEEGMIIENSVQVIHIEGETLDIIDITEKRIKKLPIETILSAMDINLCQAK